MKPAEPRAPVFNSPLPSGAPVAQTGRPADSPRRTIAHDDRVLRASAEEPCRILFDRR